MWDILLRSTPSLCYFGGNLAFNAAHADESRLKNPSDPIYRTGMLFRAAAIAGIVARTIHQPASSLHWAGEAALSILANDVAANALLAPFSALHPSGISTQICVHGVAKALFLAQLWEECGSSFK